MHVKFILSKQSAGVADSMSVTVIRLDLSELFRNLTSVEILL